MLKDSLLAETLRQQSDSMAFFETLTKLKAGLAKTRDSIVNKVQQLAATKSKIDDELLNQLEEILIAGDVGVETANIILTNLKRRVKENKYESTTQLVVLLKEEVAAILHVNDDEEPSLTTLPASSKPYVVMVVGVNGVGKTTTIGKMAYQYRQAGHKVVIGAADTFRAAANEQLEIWAQRAGVDIVQQSRGAGDAPAIGRFAKFARVVVPYRPITRLDKRGRFFLPLEGQL